MQANDSEASRNPCSVLTALARSSAWFKRRLRNLATLTSRRAVRRHNYLPTATIFCETHDENDSMLLGLGTALSVPVPGLPPGHIGSGTVAVSAGHCHHIRGHVGTRYDHAGTKRSRKADPRPGRLLRQSLQRPGHRCPGRVFSDEADVVDSTGESTRGKPAIVDMYASSFDENPSLKLEPKVEEIRFLTPDVARVEGQTRLSTETGDASEFTRFSSLLVKRDGKWLVAEIREYAVPVEDVSSYERLKELEWMVGEWVDESESVKSSSNVRWADNQSFLIRAYQVEVDGEKATSGTMFIGWDPQTGQIKSWVFDSNGGHGEGLWTRTGENEWVVKAHGVLRDGRPTSATQIHIVLNKDAIKTSSIDRIIGGEIAPDIADVVMVRTPPQPGSAPPQRAATPEHHGTGAPGN